MNPRSLKNKQSKSQHLNTTVFSWVEMVKHWPIPAFPQNAVQSEINAVRIYPNPAHGAFMVQINSLENSKAVITVSNDIGSKIFSQTKEVIKGYNQFSFPLSGLAAGIYLVQIQTDEKVTQKKLVKD